LTGIGRAGIARCRPTNIAKSGTADIARYGRVGRQGYVSITQLSTCAGIGGPTYFGQV
jgi:hypothetical protein